MLVSAWPTLFTSQDPNLQNVLGALAKPSRAHLLGTDTLGRDLYTRLIYGTRTSLLLAVWATAMGMAVGVPIGIIAGVLGGVVEKVVMRIVDVFLAFPQIILALLIVAIWGGHYWSLTTAIALGVVPGMVRIARTSTRP